MQTNQAVAALDIKIGSNVECRDGHAGRVAKLVVEPGNKRLTHLVVERGLLRRRDVLVPVERIASAEGDTVMLALNVDDLDDLPEYREVDFAMPDADWAERHGYPPVDTLIDLRIMAPTVGELAPAAPMVLVEGELHLGVPDPEAPVGRDTRITARDGTTVGKLDHVLLDSETRAVRGLVVRKGHLSTKDVMVPASWVERVGEDEIVLGVDRALLERLPEYRQARPAEQRMDGREDNLRAEQAEKRDLLSDNDVSAAVIEALARDPRTARVVLEVTYLDGSVTLRGRVRSAAEKAAAVEVARGVPGVVAVIDEIEIRADADRQP